MADTSNCIRAENIGPCVRIVDIDNLSGRVLERWPPPVSSSFETAQTFRVLESIAR